MAAKQQEKLAKKLLKRQALESKRREVATSVEGSQGSENPVAKRQRMGMPSPQVAPTNSSEVEAPGGVLSKGSSSAGQSEDRGRGPSEGFRLPEITSPPPSNMTTDEVRQYIAQQAQSMFIGKMEAEIRELLNRSTNWL
ncbi:putative histone-lysine N-methyltransferase lin-59 [Sesbania bispinosa]|nr:putative histone-lysine N-methyltransferase lin-59 [Sesbania bispinosa]